MKLFGFEIGRQKAVVTTEPMAATQQSGGGALITTPDQLDAFMRGEEGESGSGVAVTPETAMRNAPVYGCVRIITGAVANMPLHLKRKVDARTRTDVTDDPLQIVLSRKPNKWMTPSGFRRMMQAHVLLRGNAYAVKVLNARREVVGLLPLHPDRVKVEQGDDQKITYRYRRPNGAEIVFAQADIFHLIGLTLDGVTGVSVLTYARETIGFASAMQKHGSSFFRNGTNPGTVLRAKAKLGPEGVENLRQSLEVYRGAENANKTLILEEDMAFEKIGLTLVDSQFVEAIGATRTDIAMFFGLPPHMLGDTAKSTSWGTGIDSQAQGFVTYTLEDWLTGWEETINRDLIGEARPDIYARFNRASLVRGDIKTRYGAHAIGRQWGWLSANDVREAEDMNPIDGGDVYLVPLNMADPNAPPPDPKEENPDEPPQPPES